jgi:hypothetical protein
VRAARTHLHGDTGIRSERDIGVFYIGSATATATAVKANIAIRSTAAAANKFNSII